MSEQAQTLSWIVIILAILGYFSLAMVSLGHMKSADAWDKAISHQSQHADPNPDVNNPENKKVKDKGVKKPRQSTLPKRKSIPRLRPARR